MSPLIKNGRRGYRHRTASSRLLRLVPWLVALGIIAGVLGVLARVSATTTDALVAKAASLRIGNPAIQQEKDPRGSLEILRSVLADAPDNYQALVESARAYADLTNFDLAVTNLERAADVAESSGQAIGALRLAGNFLTRAGRYDEAVDKANEIVGIQPDSVQHQLHLGMAQYKGSVAIQDSITRRFVGSIKGDEELEIEERIDDYVTDLWSEPDVDKLLEVLAPDADSALRIEIRDELISARRRFLEASETLRRFNEFSGFDAGLSQGTCEVLLRSGRVFDAHVEASIALRHPRMPQPMERLFLEILAQCESLIGEHALAADRYETITQDYIEFQGWAPPRYIDQLLEERVLAADWPLLLERMSDYRSWVRDDNIIGWAEAAALAGVERRDEAREVIRDPFNVVSLGSLLPVSLRSYPARRRAILMLSYELFSEIEDSRSLNALDALVAAFPRDLEVRRARIQEFLRMGLLEAAMDDAFALHQADRRNSADFGLWMDIADQLSVEHYGLTLDERAANIVSKELDAQASYLDAEFTRFNVGGGAKDEGGVASAPAITKNPALAVAVIRARVDAFDLVQARIDSRRMSEAFPDVQMFRFALARLLVREGKLEAAATEFRDLLAQVPTDTESLDLAMRIERALGRDEQAAIMLNEMILADPQGVGAVSYAKRMLARGQPDQVLGLSTFLKREGQTELNLDHFLVLARAYLALGDINSANAVLSPLATIHSHSPEVAMLGMEIGLASGTTGLVNAAAERLEPLVGGLFPDQLDKLTTLLLDNDRPDLLLSLFDEDTRQLPAMRSALRRLAEAAKALGRIDEAIDLLRSVDDDESVRDRFLLLSLDGRHDVASRRLRLEEKLISRRADVELCELAGQALRGHRSLVDATPVERLRELTLGEPSSETALETLDALMRLLPVIDQPTDALPAEVASAPLETYPHAGVDLKRWLDLADQDTALAREVGQSLLQLLLCHQRPFWAREARFLAEHVLRELPGHDFAARTYGRLALEAGLPEEAFFTLLPLAQSPEVSIDLLQLCLRAAREADRDAQGLAVVASHQDRLDVQLLLGEALLERGQNLQALDDYLALLKLHPENDEILGATLRTVGALRRQPDMLPLLRQAMERDPIPQDLEQACIDALANLVQLSPEALKIADGLASAHPEQTSLLLAIARSWKEGPERVSELLDEILNNIPLGHDDFDDNERARTVLNAARIAQQNGLRDQARRLYDLMFQIDPGGIEHYRDVANLESEEGNLGLARRYLEVLVAVERRDKEPPLLLSRLLFEQVGQPHIAAQIVGDIFKHNAPPAAVEIQAADLYMRGDVDGAFKAFKKVATSPLVNEDTYLTVGRIAFAGGDDVAASQIFDLFLRTTTPEHPQYERVQELRGLCVLPKGSATEEPASVASSER